MKVRYEDRLKQKVIAITMENFAKAVVGMEPTDHYWKAFAN